jgi:hypothetical protein
VRGVGDEVAPQALEPAQIGHVVEDDEDPARRRRQTLGAHQDASRLDAADEDLALHRRASAAPRLLEQLVQGRIAHELDRQLAHDVVGDEQHLAQRGVDERDAAVLVDEQHALAHALEDSREQVAFRHQLSEARAQTVGQLLERASEIREVVFTLGAGAGLEVAAGHATSSDGEPAHTGGRETRGEAREHGRHQESCEATQQHHSPQRLDGPHVRRAIDADAQYAAGARPIAEWSRDVEQLTS